MHAASACGRRDSLTGQLCRTVAQLWLHKIHQLNKQTAGPWRQQRPLGPAGFQPRPTPAEGSFEWSGSCYQTGSQTRWVIPGLTKTPVATVGRLLSCTRRLDFSRHGWKRTKEFACFFKVKEKSSAWIMNWEAVNTHKLEKKINRQRRNICFYSWILSSTVVLESSGIKMAPLLSWFCWAPLTWCSRDII